MNSFKCKDKGLSEEHVKHLARFAGEKYIKGEYQKWSNFAQFKWWHYNQLKDLELKNGENNDGITI